MPMYDIIPLYAITPEQLDAINAAGFRFLGKKFFRYNKAQLFFNSYALRIRLADFKFSKSQKKVLRKNERLDVRLGTYIPSAEKEALFNKHFDAFNEEEQADILTYVNEDAATVPTPSVERCIYIGDKLVAVSICHLGGRAYNATYCFYDPEYKHYSLGNYTLFLEIQAAMAAKMDYYYIGYACPALKNNLYKMNFNNLESLDWETMEWKPMARRVPRNKD